MAEMENAEKKEEVKDFGLEFNHQLFKFPERQAIPSHLITDRLNQFNLSLNSVSITNFYRK